VNFGRRNTSSNRSSLVSRHPEGFPYSDSCFADEQGRALIIVILISMVRFNPQEFPSDLSASLARDFFIRFTTTGRKTGLPRTFESTFVWNRDNSSFIVSGYPGKRDWLANMGANPKVIVHTVERGIYYDIPTTARVLTRRAERIAPLLDFLDRWATRPEAPRRLFSLIVCAIRLNHRFRLPWWGPFWLVRKLFDRMPCVQLLIVASPARRRRPPPSRSNQE